MQSSGAFRQYCCSYQCRYSFLYVLSRCEYMQLSAIQNDFSIAVSGYNAVFVFFISKLLSWKLKICPIFIVDSHVPLSKLDILRASLWKCSNVSTSALLQQHTCWFMQSAREFHPILAKFRSFSADVHEHLPH